MIGPNLKLLRKSRNLTLEDLSNQLNQSYPDTLNFNKGKLSKWENGKEEPKLSSVRILADFYEVTVDDIIHGMAGKSLLAIYYKLDKKRKEKVMDFAQFQLDKLEKMKKIMVYGETAAGDPVEYGDVDTEEKEVSYVPKGADMALNVKGDSMEPLIPDNSIVFYKRQPSVDNGDIAIVEIEGNSVTCKKIKYDYKNEIIILQSLNPKYDDMHYKEEDLRILGKVVS